MAYEWAVCPKCRQMKYFQTTPGQSWDGVEYVMCGGCRLAAMHRGRPEWPTKLDKRRHFGTQTRMLMCPEYKPKKPKLLTQQIEVKVRADVKKKLWALQSGRCVCHGRPQFLASMVCYQTEEYPR